MRNYRAAAAVVCCMAVSNLEEEAAGVGFGFDGGGEAAGCPDLLGTRPQVVGRDRRRAARLGAAASAEERRDQTNQAATISSAEKEEALACVSLRGA